MFTGLIQDVGRIEGVTNQGNEAHIRVTSSLGPYTHGESIAVNGACLSVTGSNDTTFTVFASAETMQRTSLGALSNGNPVNLERAMTLQDHVGGHLVTGHVDTQVQLQARQTKSGGNRFRFSLPEPPALQSQLAQKGSVTLDGVSLTVNDVTDVDFEVMIIPVTLEQTTLHALRNGDSVNLETDLIAKYVARYMGSVANDNEGRVSMDLLMKSGFVR